MKNNIWNKKFIDLVACMTCIKSLAGWLKFTWVFLNKKLGVFLSILSFNIKLVRDFDS